VFSAACGDKVTQVVPTGVASVSVSPGTATLNINQSITLTASINMADASAPPVPTWTSSDPAKVSVTQGSANTTIVGLAATPGVAVCAAAGGKSGCATVLVTAAPAVIPATVSIASITVGGNINAPVNPANVVGGIDVRANVSPGNETVSKVVVLVGTTRADSQTFTAAQSAALRSAADEAVATQSAFPPILFSINTAKFSATTGVPTWVNGNYAIAIQIFVAGNTTARATATYQTPLTFNNVNTVIQTTTFTGGASATSTGGFSYKSGTMVASVLPVIYSAGVTMKVGTITFGAAGCDATGPRTVALVAPTTGNAWTGTFTTGAATNETPALGTNFLGYEFRTAAGACAAVIATGEGFTITAEDSNGNTFVPGVAPSNAAANTFRVDNVAPPQPILNYNVLAALSLPNGRTGGWLNDAVTFNGLATSALTDALNAGAGTTSNGLICNNLSAFAQNNCLVGNTAPADLGVGGVTFAVSAAASSSPTTAGAATSLTSATTLPPSATNATNCGIAYSIDALGNKSPIYTNANLTAIATAVISGSNQTCANLIAGASGFTAQRNVLRFGVDRAAPTIAFDASSLAANARINTATLAGEFVVTVADTGALGNSGMNPIGAGTTSGPVLMNMSRHRADGTATRDATGASSGATLVNTGVVYAAPLGSSSITAQSTVGASAGYWTVSVLAQDAAGNQSATLTRTVVGDNSAVIGTSPAVPATITGAFSSASFLNDNLSIRDFYYTVGFGSALIVPATITVAAAPTVVDAYNAATFSNTNFPINTSINTFLGLQNGQTTPPTAYAAGAHPINGLNLFARDQAQAAYTAVTPAPIAATAPTSGVSITNFTGAFANTTSDATLCALAAASGGCTVATATPASATLKATATGATATFNNPFSRVDFYAQNGVDLILIGSVPAASATLVDNGATRVWTYAMTIQATATFTQLGGVSGGAPGAGITRNIYAFGANSAGTVALVSPLVAQTINP
jgi:hypothetical protein